MMHPADKAMLEAIAAACERVLERNNRQSFSMTSPTAFKWLAEELRNEGDAFASSGGQQAPHRPDQVDAPAANSTFAAGERPPMPKRASDECANFRPYARMMNEALDAAEWWKERAEAEARVADELRNELVSANGLRGDAIKSARREVSKAEARVAELVELVELDVLSRRCVSCGRRVGPGARTDVKEDGLPSDCQCDDPWLGTITESERIAELEAQLADERRAHGFSRCVAGHWTCGASLDEKGAPVDCESCAELAEERYLNGEQRRRIAELEAQLKARDEELSALRQRLNASELVCSEQAMWLRDNAQREREQQAEVALPECVREWRIADPYAKRRFLERIREHGLAVGIASAADCLVWLATAPAESVARVGLTGDGETP
jgi:hypothetical protein